MGGVRLVGSSRAAIGLLAEPIVAVIVVALALGQALTVAEIAGGAAIAIAVVVVQLPPAPGRRRGPDVRDGVRPMDSRLDEPQ